MWRGAGWSWLWLRELGTSARKAPGAAPARGAQFPCFRSWEADGENRRVHGSVSAGAEVSVSPGGAGRRETWKGQGLCSQDTRFCRFPAVGSWVTAGPLGARVSSLQSGRMTLSPQRKVKMRDGAEYSPSPLRLLSKPQLLWFSLRQSRRASWRKWCLTPSDTLDHPT